MKLKMPIYCVVLIVVTICLLPCVSASASHATLEYTAPDLSILSPDEARASEKVFRTLPDDLWVQLKNGLTLIIREVTNSNAVSLRVHIKTGSIYEGEHLSAGLSHYLEHVVSGGSTRNRTEEAIQDEIKSIGGISNAFTSYDRTVYFIETTNDWAGKALNILLDTVFGCRFDEKEVAREKGVILREILMDDNDPDKMFWKLFVETAYLRHPVRYPIIGFKNVFETITRDQLLAYYQSRYVPDNAIITVVGNVNRREVLRQVIKEAGNIPRGVGPATLPEEPKRMTSIRVETVSPLSKITRVEMGFPSIPLAHPDLYAIDILSFILGEGRTSRLYRSLKDDQHLVLSVDTSSWTPSFVRGLFTISLTLEQANLEPALDGVWETIKKIQNEGPTPEELLRAKKKIVTDYYFSQESVSSIANDLTSSLADTGDLYFSSHYVDSIQSVNAETAKAAANKYLNKNSAIIAVLKPYEEKGVQTGSTTDRGLKNNPIVKTVFPNGLTLLTKTNRTSPTVSVQLYGHGGQMYEPADKPGISLFAASMLTKGTRGYSKQELASAIENMGGSLSSTSGKNTYCIAMHLMRSDLEKGFSLLREITACPTFPSEEIEKQRKDTLEALKTLDEDWDQEMTRFLNQTQFINHPYRNDLLGTTESVSAFTRDDLQRFYGSIVRPNNMVVAIFGDVEHDQAVSLVEKELGTLNAGEIPPSRSFPEEYKIKGDRVVQKENDKSSAGLMMALNGIGIASNEKPVMDVLDSLISGIGYPSGWLHQALRGRDRNLVYAVHAFPRYAPDGGNFLIISQSSPDDLDKVVQIIRSQLNRLVSEPIEPDELERAKRSLIISHEMGLETNAEQASSAAINELLGLGYDYEARYPGLIMKVSSEEIKRMAESYFHDFLIVTTVPAVKDKGD